MASSLKGLNELLQKIRKRRLLVIGDVMLDHYLLGDTTRISPEAPVQVVHVADDRYTVGGAANVAHNIAKLGAAVELVGVIGDDQNGDNLREHFKHNGIAFDERFVSVQVKTITKARVLVRNQQLCRLDYEEPPAAYAARLAGENLKAIEAKIAGVDAVILSDYAKGVVTSEVVDRVAKIAKKLGKFIALDPKPANDVSLRGLDLVTPNRQEAIELSGLRPEANGIANLAKICAAVRAKYRPRNLVITLGSDGMLISARPGQIETIPTAARQVFDVSGAGDTVIASLTLALTSGADLRQAADFANAAAGVVVGKAGTATVTPEELTAYVR